MTMEVLIMEFNWFVMIANLIAFVIIFVKGCGLTVTTLQVNWIFKAGLWVSGIGLLGQAYRNGIFLYEGYSPVDNELPLWVLKDVGIWIIAGSFFKKGEQK